MSNQSLFTVVEKAKGTRRASGRKSVQFEAGEVERVALFHAACQKSGAGMVVYFKSRAGVEQFTRDEAHGIARRIAAVARKSALRLAVAPIPVGRNDDGSAVYAVAGRIPAQRAAVVSSVTL